MADKRKTAPAAEAVEEKLAPEFVPAPVREESNQEAHGYPRERRVAQE